MKTHFKFFAVGVTATIIGLGLSGCDRTSTSSNTSTEGDYESQLRAESTARQKDPAWKPTHKQTAVIALGQKGKGGNLTSFCVNRDGNLLVCWGGKAGTADKDARGLKVVSPEGKVTATWPLDFAPQAVAVHKSGDIFVGGQGKLARLDATGKVVATAKSPALDQPAMSESDIKALLPKNQQSDAAAVARYQKTMEGRRQDITGLGVTDGDVFVACAAAKGFGYAAYRLDHELKNPKLVVDKLSGCCGQMDLTGASDGKLWVAHNGRHRVECFDRDGKKLASLGKEDRKAADGFGGCCEPKNIRCRPNGEFLAAESGPPVAIKRFSADGKFLGVVGLPTFDSGCVRVTVDVSPDGNRYYLLNGEDDAIFVFAAQ